MSSELSAFCWLCPQCPTWVVQVIVNKYLLNEWTHAWVNECYYFAEKKKKKQEPNKQKYQEQGGEGDYRSVAGFHISLVWWQTSGHPQHFLGSLWGSKSFSCYTKNAIWLFCSTDACTGDTEAMWWVGGVEGGGFKNAGPSAGIKQLQQTVLVASEFHRKENKKPVHVRTPFNETVKSIHLIKSQPLNTDPFNILCEKLLYP